MKTNTYEYIDVHTHVNLRAYEGDWKEVLEHTLNSGVAMINVGTQIDTSRRAVELADQCTDGVYATVGVHPVHTAVSHFDAKELGAAHAGEKGLTTRGEVFDKEVYRSLAIHKKVVAIGECGLDYFRVEKDTKEKQEAAFIAQIELANELNKPLMLHIRPSEKSVDAYEDAFQIVKQHAKVLGNVHFFAGTPEVAKKFWDIGYSTSFTGVITFTHDYDESVKLAPKELIHAETDAPYVTPVPHRGTRNEPLHVREVYKKIAALRGEDEEVLRMQLVANGRTFFGVPDSA